MLATRGFGVVASLIGFDYYHLNQNPEPNLRSRFLVRLSLNEAKPSRRSLQMPGPNLPRLYQLPRLLCRPQQVPRLRPPPLFVVTYIVAINDKNIIHGGPVFAFCVTAPHFTHLPTRMHRSPLALDLALTPRLVSSASIPARIKESTLEASRRPLYMEIPIAKAPQPTFYSSGSSQS